MLATVAAAKKNALSANQRSLVICDTYATVVVGTQIAQPKRLQERIKQYLPKAIRQRITPREPTGPNQPEPSQIENAKQNLRLNSNQRAIQPLANICWDPNSAHATILIRGLKF